MSPSRRNEKSCSITVLAVCLLASQPVGSAQTPDLARPTGLVPSGRETTRRRPPAPAPGTTGPSVTMPAAMLQKHLDSRAGYPVPPPPPSSMLPTAKPSIKKNTPPSEPLTIPGKQGDDVTDALVMQKGMKVSFPIARGLDTHWKKVGDYIFEVTVDYNDHRGYGFDWKMSLPANARGFRAVEAEDVRDAYKISLFYPDREEASLVGYTSIMRISDHLYEKLKSGEPTRFALDGPNPHLEHHQRRMPVPSEIRGLGGESFPITINGLKRTVRAIKAQTDTGWTYWIMDNRKFPLMLAGSGPFGWSVQSLEYSDVTNGKSSTKKSTSDGAKKEASKVIDQLKRTGKATSYLILFDFDSDRLRPLSREILTELATYLRKNPALRLQVEGHTCTLGGKRYNDRLSQRRALSVKRFLTTQCGIAPTRLIPVGFGYSRPVSSNATEMGREKNRRVVFQEIGSKSPEKRSRSESQRGSSANPGTKPDNADKQLRNRGGLLQPRL